MADSSRNNSQRLWRTGAEALRNGDGRTALSNFRMIVAEGRADAAVWLGVALAARSLGEVSEQLEALDQVLALEPRNIRALMMKGDHFASQGDSRAADAFYSAVSKLAEMTSELPPDLLQDVGRANAARAHHAQAYEQHLRRYLTHRGMGRDGTRRISTAVDLLTGRKEIFQQQPLVHYLPELPQIQFYERSAFSWLAKVEAASADIRTELVEVLKDDGAFSPYIEGESDRPVFDNLGLLNDPSWSAFYLWKSGEPLAENIARCPKTAAAMTEAPLCRIPGRTPSVLFSLLRPGTRIPPHHGFMNSRLICHLPLIVPGRCALRVGNHTRVWEEGRAWVFDDTIEHEAWNNSGELRVVMIFDIWRPELTPVERDLVSATLEAIDAFSGGHIDLSV